jgi:hypothetical protein
MCARDWIDQRIASYHLPRPVRLSVRHPRYRDWSCARARWCFIRLVTVVAPLLGVPLTFLLPFPLGGLGEACGGKVGIPFALDFKFLQGPDVIVLIVSQEVHSLG